MKNPSDIWLYVYLLLCGLVGAFSVHHLWQQQRGSLDTSAALVAMKRWPQGRPASEVEWAKVEVALQRALSDSGGNADIHEAIGSVYLSWPSDQPLDLEKWQQRLLVARHHLELSLSMRPIGPGAWSKLAFTWDGLRRLGAVENADARLWEAFDRAMMTGFRVASVQLRLLDLAMSRWGELTEDRRAAVRDMYAQATTAQQKRLQERARRRGVVLE